jgi:hypothetical protein
MEQLQHAVLVLLAISALVTVAALAVGFYEFRTGRLVRIPSRRKIPATPDDIRRNGLALVLNDLGVLLTDTIVLSSFLLHDVRFDPLLAVSSIAVGAAGFTAALLSILTSLRIRGEIHYLERSLPGSLPSAQP